MLLQRLSFCRKCAEVTSFGFSGLPRNRKHHQKSLWICYPSLNIRQKVLSMSQKGSVLHSLWTLQPIHNGPHSKSQSLILSTNPLSLLVWYMQQVCQLHDSPIHTLTGALFWTEKRSALWQKPEEHSAAAKFPTLDLCLHASKHSPWGFKELPQTFHTSYRFVSLKNLSTEKSFFLSLLNYNGDKYCRCIFLPNLWYNILL